MKLAEAYFDESATHEGSAAVCVAGYIFESERAVALTGEWCAMLAQHSLPFFRMSDCAHGNGPFKGMGIGERDQVARRAIELIKTYASAGVAVSLEMDSFQLIPKPEQFKTPYGFACSQVLFGVRSWLEISKFDGEIAYVFEAGSVNQSEANRLLNSVFDKPDLKLQFRYASLTFSEKANAPLLQCADILAWQWHTYNRRLQEGKKQQRADFRSLMENRNVDVHHYDRESILKWLKLLRNTNHV